MDRVVGGGDKASSPPPKKSSKFAVYQNPALSAALTSTTTLRPPSTSTFLFILSLSTASSFALLSLISREDGIIGSLKLRYISPELAYLFAKAIETMVGLVLLGTILALIKAISIWRSKNFEAVVVSPRKGIKKQTRLTNRQLGLLGIRPKVEQINNQRDTCIIIHTQINNQQIHT